MKTINRTYKKMIKATRYLITATLAFMTLAGCGNEGNDPIAYGKKDCPDFTATIGGVQSRAYDRNWETGDEIGVSGSNRSNVCHRTNDGSGSFTVGTPGEQIYFQDDDEVVFTAYYPWTTLDEGVSTIDTDTRLQSGQKGFDFLWAQASGKKAAPEVAFNFAHRMVKVVLTVKPGNGVTYDEVKSTRLSLEGFSHNGTFNITDGSTTLAAADNAGQDIWRFTDNDCKAPSAFDETGNTVTYSLIFFPQSHNVPVEFIAEIPGNNTLRAAIDFTAANSEKDGAQAANEWVAGRQYNLTVTLHKTAASLDQCDITSWIEVNDDIEVD